MATLMSENDDTSNQLNRIEWGYVAESKIQDNRSNQNVHLSGAGMSSSFSSFLRLIEFRISLVYFIRRAISFYCDCSTFDNAS